MLYENPTQDCVSGRLHYLGRAVMEKKKVSCSQGSHNLAYIERIIMYYMHAYSYQVAVYHTLLASKASGSHLIRRSNEIC